MPRPRPPHLRREKTRHGKLVWYVRRNEGARIRLTAEYGTSDFWDQYDAALRGEKLAKSRERTGSLRWLLARYRETTAWTQLSDATRRQRDYLFAQVVATAGEEQFGAITRRAIEAGRDRRAKTPSQARNFLDAMFGLFRWAVEAGHLANDPTAGVRYPKAKATEGFKAWTEDDVAKYEARWPEGTPQRVWLHVLLYVGCRRGDAVAIGRQHVRDGILLFTTEKGRDRRRIEVARVIEPELAATLEAGPCGDMAFICGEKGRPFTKESFGNVFKQACVAAGITDKSAHGLRKLSATLWAQRGASEHELMAMFGWLTPAMAAHYTRHANRKTLAKNAAARLLGTSVEQSIAAPNQKVRRKS